MSMRYFRRLRQAAGGTLSIALLLMVVSRAPSGHAETPILQIQIGADKRQFSTAELLSNPAMRSIEIARDASYPRPMRYQAVPLLDLLHGLPTGEISTLEASPKTDSS